jgi:metal-dependent amidase/aminoacylase/carboxypeptidase family protein
MIAAHHHENESGRAHPPLGGRFHAHPARPARRASAPRRGPVGSIAAAFGARATLAYERVYPPTINHDADAMFAADVAETLIGRENVVRNLDPSMRAEDFSFMLQAKPGAFARLGQGGAEHGAFLHSSRYDFNDGVIALGAGYLAALAEQAMPVAAA